MAIPMEQWIFRLEAELDKKEDSLAKANDSENPNDERIEKLETQSNLLEEMINLLNEYQDL